MLPYKYASLFGGTLLVFSSFSGHAAIWDGSESSDWTNPLNWDGDTYPGSSDAIYINIDGSGSEYAPILSSGSVQVGNTYIGNTEGNGKLTVTGTDESPTSLAINGSLNIGNNADIDGELSISGNSTVNVSGRMYFGSSSNTKATVSISGSGKLVSASGQSYLGEHGRVDITITENGQLAGADLLIGASSDGGLSTIDISGSGLMKSTGQTIIGHSSYAETIVHGSGRLEVGNQLIIGYFPGGGKLTLANNAVVTVTNGLIVGHQGTTAELIVNGNAQVISKTGWISNTNLSNASVTVSDNAKWDITEGLAVGRGGNGSLTIDGTQATVNIGTTVSFGNTADTADGTITVRNGGTLSAQQFTVSSGSGSVTLDNGTIVAATGAQQDYTTNLQFIAVNSGGGTVNTNGNDIAIAASFTGAGLLHKTGIGTLTVSGNSTQDGLNINQGSVVAASQGGLGTGLVVISAGTSLNSSVVNVTTGAITLNAGGTLGANGSGTGSYVLTDGDFLMDGGLWELTLQTTSDFDYISGDLVSSFTLGSGTVSLSYVPDYNARYYILQGFDSSTSSVGAISITGYDSANYTASIDNEGYLSFTARTIPEPSSFTFCLLALGAALVRRKRFC